MLQNYIFIEGKKYNSGSIFIVNCMGKESEAILIGYNRECESYFFKINNKTCRMKSGVFQKSFICATNRIDTHTRIPTEKKRKDGDIDGLFLGWVWYIFLMAISLVFKGTLALWITLSVLFFCWRAKKIKEDGTYIEW
jgi:hypothetical protein